MPVLFARSKEHDVTGPNRLDRPPVTLHASEPGQDQDGLPERMGVPGRPRARLEGDGGARERAAAGERRVDPNVAGKIIRAGAFADGCDPARLMSMPVRPSAGANLGRPSGRD